MPVFGMDSVFRQFSNLGFGCHTLVYIQNDWAKVKLKN